MRDLENSSGSLRRRADGGKQPVVVRQLEQKPQLDEVVERLARLETLSQTSANALRAEIHAQPTRLELRNIVAIAAILVSIAGYVVQEARTASRQDAEIEATKIRVTNLEKIAAANTEARVRSEVELSELRKGQGEIKDLLRTHDDQIMRARQRK